jgi:hypothetical protein
MEKVMEEELPNELTIDSTKQRHKQKKNYTAP